MNELTANMKTEEAIKEKIKTDLERARRQRHPPETAVEPYKSRKNDGIFTTRHQ